MNDSQIYELLISVVAAARYSIDTGETIYLDRLEKDLRHDFQLACLKESDND